MPCYDLLLAPFSFLTTVVAGLQANQGRTEWKEEVCDLNTYLPAVRVISSDPCPLIQVSHVASWSVVIEPVMRPGGGISGTR